MPVHGRMYLQRGDAASYDIQLDNNVGALDILKILSPTAETAENVLGNIATRINVPDLDLSKSINENLKLNNAGIILRQHQPLFVSVSVDDFYGTIVTSEVLQVAGDLLPGTKDLKIPTNLPDLTLMIHHATGGGEKVCALVASWPSSDEDRFPLRSRKPLGALGLLLWKLDRRLTTRPKLMSGRFAIMAFPSTISC